MFFKLLIISLSLIVVQEVVAKDVSIRSSLYGFLRKNNKIDRCYEPGFSCSDCDTSVFCFELPNGDFITDEEPCLPGETCVSETGRCSSDPNLECIPEMINYKFTCYQIGIFPHVFDCTKYHMCIDGDDGEIIEKSKDYNCNVGLEFDPHTGMCSRKVDGPCKPIVDQCTRLGQSGPVVGNKYMFYTCINMENNGERILFPHVFYCTNGEQYINEECRDPTPPSGLDADGNCEANGEFYDAGDCKKFNTCTAGNNPDSNNCGPNNYYDGWEKTCKPFECP